MSKVSTILHGVRTVDGATWTITEDDLGCQELIFGAEKTIYDVDGLFGAAVGAKTRRTHVLADYDPRSRILNTYPISAKPGSSRMFEPKYHRIKRISLERQNSIKDQLDDDETQGFSGPNLAHLPSGFVRSILDGLGLIYPLRYIVGAFEGMEGVNSIVICEDGEINRDGTDIRLPISQYDEVRRAIKRAHDAALMFAARDKAAYVTGELTDRVLRVRSAGAFRQGVDVLTGRLADALSGKRARFRNTANAEAAVKTVRSAAAALAAEAPGELYELNREIELVSLTKLIEIFRSKMDKGHHEAHWQKFLTANPFILRLAFGYPVTVFGEQVSVGGGKFTGGGTKIADYLVRSGLLGNVSLIEIKRPKTRLLAKKTFRGGVYSPSKELAESVTQVLDQRHQLQKNMSHLKENSDVRDIWAYAVQCIVIAGTIPSDSDGRKSLELFRSNLRDVTVVTFDELLEKLTSLREFLTADSNASTIEPVLLGDDGEDREEDADWEEDEDERSPT